jgi:hypothetical protein
LPEPAAGRPSDRYVRFMTSGAALDSELLCAAWESYQVLDDGTNASLQYLTDRQLRAVGYWRISTALNAPGSAWI